MQTNSGVANGEHLNDVVSAEGIRPFLSDCRNAEKIRVFESLESTNETAKEMALSNAEHGTVIIADRQTAGKGRFDRKFFSPPGGLYMSFVLHPERLHFENTTAVTAFAAVAVCEAIETVTGGNPMIKWVNDIFMDGLKVCGILAETVTTSVSEKPGWIVLGIGINFSTQGFPDDLRGIAGCICRNGDTSVTRNRLAAEIINRILRENPLSEKEIFAEYRKRLMMMGESSGKLFLTEAQRKRRL